jgi:hypothetical protein
MRRVFVGGAGCESAGRLERSRERCDRLDEERDDRVA